MEVFKADLEFRVDKALTSKAFKANKRTLDELLNTEQWVRNMRLRLQGKLYGAFSFFSRLPLELLYCILEHLLVHDLRNTGSPWASVGLLSTCRDARALLPGWCAHAHRILGGIPTQQELGVSFYLKALCLVRYATFQEAGCDYNASPLVTRGKVNWRRLLPSQPFLHFLVQHNYSEAVEWVVTSSPTQVSMHQLLALSEKGTEHDEFIVEQVSRLASKYTPSFIDYQQMYIWRTDKSLVPSVARLLDQVVARAFGNRDAWVHGFRLMCVTQLHYRPQESRELLRAFLPLYQEGWLTSWAGLPVPEFPEFACLVAHYAPALQDVPVSGTDNAVNPLVRQNLMKFVCAPGWVRLSAHGLTCAPTGVAATHTCRLCKSVRVTERVKRLHSRGCTVHATQGLLKSCGTVDELVKCAKYFTWAEGGPTAEDLKLISDMRGSKCVGMAKLYEVCQGTGQWRVFVFSLNPGCPLRRRLERLLGLVVQ
jgi:hypothetical protein